MRANAVRQGPTNGVRRKLLASNFFFVLRTKHLATLLFRLPRALFPILKSRRHHPLFSEVSESRWRSSWLQLREDCVAGA